MNFPRRFLKIFLSLVAAAFFLWLAFREVNVQELWKQIIQVKLGWILPFALTMLVSHYLRAERWLLLLTGLEKKPTRSTLFTGVMLGYLMNYVFPRLGEVTRPVYVARQLNISSGRLLGTIVLERVIDLVSLIGFLMVVIFYFIGDHQAFGRIFGAGSWTTRVFLLVPAFLLLLTVLTWAGYRTLQSLKRGNRHPLMARFVDYGTLFWKGFSSLRRVENWPLFVLLTVCIWFGYILMAYLSF
ncbi:MAG: lysylphosphatidylglycerol synthase transmembrane domain-containing protein, partial [Balneolaceae bacterium]